MIASRRVLLAVLATSVVIGILGDQLLRPAPWGIGFSIWIGTSVGAALFFLVWARAEIRPLILVLLGIAFCFAAALSWRAAPRLMGWNVFATIIALALAFLHIRGLALWSARATDYAGAVLNAGLAAAFGPFLALAREYSSHSAQQPRTRVFRGASLGVLVALILLVVFGALFMAADPLFEQLIRRVFDWDFERIVSHAVVIGALSWLSATFLRAVVQQDEDDPQVTVPSVRVSLGILEVGIPMGAVTLLFAVFVIVQARWLFGGEDVIRAAVGLTYAEYARRGFFELITVAGLIIPLLMAGDWAIGEKNPLATRRFRALAVTQLVLVGAILVSAVARLWLYQEAYGLTETRLYAAAFMLWIALTLTWFGMSVLRGQRGRFVAGAAMAGFMVVGSLNVLNPDGTIVRSNIARAAAGKELDISYLTSLSADAAPHLLDGLPPLSVDDRCAIARHLTEASDKQRGANWRTWNVGRSGAAAVGNGARPVVNRCRAPTVSPLEEGRD